MKKLILISTGRCGTKRISEILRSLLVDFEIEVSHQRPLSRLCNVLGNLMYYTGNMEFLKRILFKIQLKTGKGGAVFCDPLTAMCLPKNIVENPDVFLLHVTRNDHEFAQSMFRLTRKRFASMFAHNFIPWWQPSVWPLENLFNPNIIKKYERVSQLKNSYFEGLSVNPNYRKVTMQTCFEDGFLNELIKEVFELEIKVDRSILNIKSNQST